MTNKLDTPDRTYCSVRQPDKVILAGAGRIMIISQKSCHRIYRIQRMFFACEKLKSLPSRSGGRVIRAIR